VFPPAEAFLTKEEDDMAAVMHSSSYTAGMDGHSASRTTPSEGAARPQNECATLNGLSGLLVCTTVS
jgi:hypothetical protein